MKEGRVWDERRKWRGFWEDGWGCIVGMLTWDGLVKRWQKQIKQLFFFFLIRKRLDHFISHTNTIFFCSFLRICGLNASRSSGCTSFAVKRRLCLCPTSLRCEKGFFSFLFFPASPSFLRSDAGFAAFLQKNNLQIKFTEQLNAPVRFPVPALHKCHERALEISAFLSSLLRKRGSHQILEMQQKQPRIHTWTSDGESFFILFQDRMFIHIDIDKRVLRIYSKAAQKQKKATQLALVCVSRLSQLGLGSRICPLKTQSVGPAILLVTLSPFFTVLCLTVNFKGEK